jgi:hypothetical protein
MSSAYEISFCESRNPDFTYGLKLWNIVSYSDSVNSGRC